MSNQSELESLMMAGIHPGSGRVWISPSVGFGQDVSINILSSAGPLRGMQYLADQGHKTIQVEINTDGGDVDQGLAIIDLMNELQAEGIEVIATVRGVAYSMGAAILQAGSIRRMSKHSHLMIHDGEALIQADSRKSRKNWHAHNKHLDNCYNQVLLDRLVEKNPEFKKATLTKWLSADTIFTAEECLELGFCDEIIGRKETV